MSTSLMTSSATIPSNPLSAEEIYRRLKEHFTEKVILQFYDPKKDPAQEDPKVKAKPAGDCFIVVSPEEIVSVCTFLRKETPFAFDSLMCLGALDGESCSLEGKDSLFTVVYELHSLVHRHRVCLHCRLSKDKPRLPSVVRVWSGADWFEREAYDLFGIEFENHPDLRRLLLPPDWVGFPLRKNYEFPKEYNGISCVRPKLK